MHKKLQRHLLNSQQCNGGNRNHLRGAEYDGFNQEEGSAPSPQHPKADGTHYGPPRSFMQDGHGDFARGDMPNCTVLGQQNPMDMHFFNRSSAYGARQAMNVCTKQQATMDSQARPVVSQAGPAEHKGDLLAIAIADAGIDTDIYENLSDADSKPGSRVTTPVPLSVATADRSPIVSERLKSENEVHVTRIPNMHYDPAKFPATTTVSEQLQSPCQMAGYPPSFARKTEHSPYMPQVQSALQSQVHRGHILAPPPTLHHPPHPTEAFQHRTNAPGMVPMTSHAGPHPQWANPMSGQNHQGSVMMVHNSAKASSTLSSMGSKQDASVIVVDTQSKPGQPHASCEEPKPKRKRGRPPKAPANRPSLPQPQSHIPSLEPANSATSRHMQFSYQPGQFGGQPYNPALMNVHQHQQQQNHRQVANVGLHDPKAMQHLPGVSASPQNLHPHQMQQHPMHQPLPHHPHQQLPQPQQQQQQQQPQQQQQQPQQQQLHHKSSPTNQMSPQQRQEQEKQKRGYHPLQHPQNHFNTHGMQRPHMPPHINQQMSSQDQMAYRAMLQTYEQYSSKGIVPSPELLVRPPVYQPQAREYGKGEINRNPAEQLPKMSSATIASSSSLGSTSSAGQSLPDANQLHMYPGMPQQHFLQSHHPNNMHLAMRMHNFPQTGYGHMQLNNISGHPVSTSTNISQYPLSSVHTSVASTGSSASCNPTIHAMLKQQPFQSHNQMLHPERNEPQTTTAMVHQSGKELFMQKRKRSYEQAQSSHEAPTNIPTSVNYQQHVAHHIQKATEQSQGTPQKVEQIHNQTVTHATRDYMSTFAVHPPSLVPITVSSVTSQSCIANTLNTIPVTADREIPKSSTCTTTTHLASTRSTSIMSPALAVTSCMQDTGSYVSYSCLDAINISNTNDVVASVKSAEISTQNIEYLKAYRQTKLPTGATGKSTGENEQSISDGNNFTRGNSTNETGTDVALKLQSQISDDITTPMVSVQTTSYGAFQVQDRCMPQEEDNIHCLRDGDIADVSSEVMSSKEVGSDGDKLKSPLPTTSTSESHMREGSGVLVAGLSVSTKAERKERPIIPNKRETHACYLCRECFKEVKDIKHHINRAHWHWYNEPYVCKECLVIGKNWYDFQQHVYQVHRRAPPHHFIPKRILQIMYAMLIIPPGHDVPLLSASHMGKGTKTPILPTTDHDETEKISNSDVESKSSVSDLNVKPSSPERIPSPPSLKELPKLQLLSSVEPDVLDKIKKSMETRDVITPPPEPQTQEPPNILPKLSECANSVLHHLELVDNTEDVGEEPNSPKSNPGSRRNSQENTKQAAIVIGKIMKELQDKPLDDSPPAMIVKRIRNLARTRKERNSCDMDDQTAFSLDDPNQMSIQYSELSEFEETSSDPNISNNEEMRTSNKEDGDMRGQQFAEFMTKLWVAVTIKLNCEAPEVKDRVNEYYCESFDGDEDLAQKRLKILLEGTPLPYEKNHNKHESPLTIEREYNDVVINLANKIIDNHKCHSVMPHENSAYVSWNAQVRNGIQMLEGQSSMLPNYDETINSVIEESVKIVEIWENDRLRRVQTLKEMAKGLKTKTSRNSVAETSVIHPVRHKKISRKMITQSRRQKMIDPKIKKGSSQKRTSIRARLLSRVGFQKSKTPLVNFKCGTKKKTSKETNGQDISVNVDAIDKRKAASTRKIPSTKNKILQHVFKKSDGLKKIKQHKIYERFMTRQSAEDPEDDDLVPKENSLIKIFEKYGVDMNKFDERPQKGKDDIQDHADDDSSVTSVDSSVYYPEYQPDIEEICPGGNESTIGDNFSNSDSDNETETKKQLNSPSNEDPNTTLDAKADAMEKPKLSENSQLLHLDNPPVHVGTDINENNSVEIGEPESSEMPVFMSEIDICTEEVVTEDIGEKLESDPDKGKTGSGSIPVVVLKRLTKEDIDRYSGSDMEEEKEPPRRKKPSKLRLDSNGSVGDNVMSDGLSASSGDEADFEDMEFVIELENRPDEPPPVGTYYNESHLPFDVELGATVTVGGENDETVRTDPQDVDRYAAFFCSICDFSNMQEKCVKSHMTRYHGKRRLAHKIIKKLWVRWQCLICEFTSLSKDEIENHIKKDHVTLEPLLECPSCDVKCEDVSGVNDHILMAHQDVSTAMGIAKKAEKVEKDVIQVACLCDRKSIAKDRYKTACKEISRLSKYLREDVDWQKEDFQCIFCAFSLPSEYFIQVHGKQHMKFQEYSLESGEACENVSKLLKSTYGRLSTFVFERDSKLEIIHSSLDMFLLDKPTIVKLFGDSVSLQSLADSNTQERIDAAVASILPPEENLQETTYPEVSVDNSHFIDIHGNPVPESLVMDQQVVITETVRNVIVESSSEEVEHAVISIQDVIDEHTLQSITDTDPAGTDVQYDVQISSETTLVVDNQSEQSKTCIAAGKDKDKQSAYVSDDVGFNRNVAECPDNCSVAHKLVLDTPENIQDEISNNNRTESSKLKWSKTEMTEQQSREPQTEGPSGDKVEWPKVSVSLKTMVVKDDDAINFIDIDVTSIPLPPGPPPATKVADDLGNTEHLTFDKCNITPKPNKTPDEACEHDNTAETSPRPKSTCPEVGYISTSNDKPDTEVQVTEAMTKTLKHIHTTDDITRSVQIYPGDKQVHIVSPRENQQDSNNRELQVEDKTIPVENVTCSIDDNATDILEYSKGQEKQLVPKIQMAELKEHISVNDCTDIQADSKADETKTDDACHTNVPHHNNMDVDSHKQEIKSSDKLCVEKTQTAIKSNKEMNSTSQDKRLEDLTGTHSQVKHRTAIKGSLPIGACANEMSKILPIDETDSSWKDKSSLSNNLHVNEKIPKLRLRLKSSKSSVEEGDVEYQIEKCIETNEKGFHTTDEPIKAITPEPVKTIEPEKEVLKCKGYSAVNSSNLISDTKENRTVHPTEEVPKVHYYISNEDNKRRKHLHKQSLFKKEPAVDDSQMGRKRKEQGNLSESDRHVKIIISKSSHTAKSSTHEKQSHSSECINQETINPKMPQIKCTEPIERTSRDIKHSKTIPAVSVKDSSLRFPKLNLNSTKSNSTVKGNGYDMSPHFRDISLDAGKHKGIQLKRPILLLSDVMKPSEVFVKARKLNCSIVSNKAKTGHKEETKVINIQKEDKVEVPPKKEKDKGMNFSNMLKRFKKEKVNTKLTFAPKPAVKTGTNSEQPEMNIRGHNDVTQKTECAESKSLDSGRNVWDALKDMLA